MCILSVHIATTDGLPTDCQNRLSEDLIQEAAKLTYIVIWYSLNHCNDTASVCFDVNYTAGHGTYL